MLLPFAILDLISAVTLFLISYGFIVKALIICSAVYLLVKGFIFIKDPASILDIIIGLSLLISLAVALPKIITIIFAIFLLQKALFSFISS